MIKVDISGEYTKAGYAVKPDGRAMVKRLILFHTRYCFIVLNKRFPFINIFWYQAKIII